MTADERIQTKTAKRPRKKRVKRGMGVLSFLTTIFVLALFIAGLFLASGRSIEAPGWLRTYIAEQAGEQIDKAELHFGGLQLVVVEGWQPRLRLNDVRLDSLEKETIVAFSQMDVAISLPALFEGALRPSEVALAGVFASMRRDADGQLSISGGFDLEGPVEQAPSFAALAKRLDAILLLPEMSQLHTVDLQALTLRFEDARTARAWTIDGGRMRLTREGDDVALSADLAVLSGAAGIATVTASYSSVLGAPAADFGVRVENVDAVDIAAQGPAFAWLEALRAPISGALRSGLDETGALAPLNATLSIGSGALQPTDATRPVPFEGAQTYFTYLPAKQELRFDELSVKSKWATGTASGTAWLGLSEDGSFHDLVAQLDLNELSLNPFEIYEGPRRVSKASADLRMTLDPFRIELGEAVLDLEGDVVQARGDIIAEAKGWQFSLDGHLDETTPESVLAWWPKSFAEKVRTWLAANILNAELEQVDIALRRAPGQKIQSFVGFDYAEADVRFMKTMPPVKEAKGQVTLEENRVVVSVDAGSVTAPVGGNLNVAGSSFIIPDIRVKGGAPAHVDLRSESPIQAALSIIDQPPLRVLERAGRKPDLAEGVALVEGRIALPLRKGLKTEEVDYDLSGQLSDVTSTNLVDNRRLSAQSLVLTATPEEVLIGGPGKIDGVPFEAAWQQLLGQEKPGQVSGSVALTQATLDTFGVGLPKGTVSGSARGDLTVTLTRNGAPRFSLSSNLRGATLRLAPLGWSKPAGTAGKLRISGTLGNRPTIDRVEISAPGLSATGGVTLNANGTLNEARFARVQTGGWLDAPVSLVGRGKGRPPAVRVTGGRMDLRKAKFGGGGSSGSGNGPMTISLNQLQISDAIAFSNFAGQFAAGRSLDGRFTARVNGGPQVEGRVIPQGGRSAISLTSNNAGGVMAAAGLLKQAVGGQMSLTLLPVQGAEGVFDGTLKINQTRVKKAPVMADLLSALSIVGLLEQLSGNGIAFNEVEADFRMSPNQVVLRRSSAVGPSMGISMDGRYAMANGQLDMQGVISPVYFLNAIGQIFSRRGEGLIGFNYRLRGTSSAPRVQVNPLSALTPGVFREIFRAPPPDLPAADAPRALIPEGLEPEQKKSKAQLRREKLQRERDNR